LSLLAFLALPFLSTYSAKHISIFVEDGGTQIGKLIFKLHWPKEGNFRQALGKKLVPHRPYQPLLIELS